MGYVIWAPDEESEAPTAEMRRMAAAVAEALLARDSLIVELGPHLACWSTAGSRPALARFTGLPRFAGLGATVGTLARGVDGFRLSHQEALMARRVARLAGSSEALTTSPTLRSSRSPCMTSTRLAASCNASSVRLSPTTLRLGA